MIYSGKIILYSILRMVSGRKLDLVSTFGLVPTFGGSKFKIHSTFKNNPKKKQNLNKNI